MKKKKPTGLSLILNVVVLGIFLFMFLSPISPPELFFFGFLGSLISFIFLIIGLIKHFKKRNASGRN